MSNKNYKEDDDENKSWSSWGPSKVNKFTRKTSLRNESAAKYDDEPATKKTKSEPKEEEFLDIRVSKDNEDRGIFSSENMKKDNESTFFENVVKNLPPRPEQKPTSPSKTSSSKTEYMYRSPSKVLSPLVGGPIPNQSSQYLNYSSPDSQVSGFSHSSGLTGYTAKNTLKSDLTSSFAEMQQQMEQQQKDIENWKQIVNKKESSQKKLKKTLAKLDDHNKTFEYKKGIMEQYLSDSDTSGSDASHEQAEEEEEEEEIKKTAAEEEGPDNLKDVFNDEKSDSDSEPTPDAIINFTENLTILHNQVDKSKNPLEKETLESNLNRMNDQLTELLNQEEITAKNLEALFDPTKINCEEKSDECSLLSITTTMLMNEETLSKLRGNKTVEDSKNRNRNINNIIEIMYKNAIHKKIHTDSGVKKSNRDTIERYMGTDSQFMNVWGGANQTIEKSEWAKEKCCYLCQGLNVYNDGITSPEMEHKLPSLEFYTKVHNINEYYPELLQKWRQYVDNNLKSIQALYSYINCSTSNWAMAKNLLDTKLNNYLKTFQAENSSDEDINKFIALLKVYLMEFAYSHHTCNQMKENSNLNDPKTRDIYIKSVKVAIQKGSYTSQPLLKPVKLLAERSNIIMDDKSFDNIGGHMSLINDYIEEYALILYEDEAREIGKKTLNTITEYCLKKIMLQSLKSTVNFLIEYKNKEKRKNAAKILNNQSEQYIDMLDILDNLKEVFDEYNTLRGRAQSNYTKRTRQDAYSKSNKYNLFLDKMDNLDDDNTVKKLILYGKTDDIKDDDNIKLETMEINTMYNNLFNSNKFQTLLSEYKAKPDKFQNLSNYLDKYVSKEGGKNKTKKNKPKNETRRIKIKSNRKTRRRRRSNNKSKKNK